MSAAYGAQLSDRWFTPPNVLDLVRAFIGEIDLDPCSEEQANALVRAKRYYTAEDDGLSKTWYGRVFVNPPGGKSRLTQKFWEKLVDEYAAGHVPAAAYLSFSIDTLQTLQKFNRGIADFPTFVFDKRIKYWQPGELGAEPSKSAMRPSCLTILPQDFPTWGAERKVSWTQAAKAFTRDNRYTGTWIVAP